MPLLPLQVYAMKMLRKEHVVKRNQVEHTKTERNVLETVVQRVWAVDASSDTEPRAGSPACVAVRRVDCRLDSAPCEGLRGPFDTKWLKVAARLPSGWWPRDHA